MGLRSKETDCTTALQRAIRDNAKDLACHAAGCRVVQEALDNGIFYENTRMSRVYGKPRTY